MVVSGRAGPEGPPPEVVARFAEARVARLATATPGGPRLVPVTFAWHEGALVWAVDSAKPKRTRRLRRLADLEADPRVALLVDHYADDWGELWWVELRGTAAVLEGRAAEAALDALAARYPAYRADRPPGPVVAVTPDGWTWWSAR
ncbi:MAG TPA: TIGR03668 family PPOX class F420-dependent oxidoreductase [Actinomycetota bacterium]|nr:TIGR03668 family PPOX class F420-dependent oxidoreductase [Actinomycetota bacterium]